MKILLDAMGGDNAPDAAIRGAIRASKEINAHIVLVGNEEIINSKIKEFYGKEKISDITDKISIRHRNISGTSSLENHQHLGKDFTIPR